ncbi:hypothetical protein PTKIN_Ptkin12aG0030700 [Pterospermum kingtungense]
MDCLLLREWDGMVKTCPYEDSFSLQKELQIFKRFVGCDNIVQCYGDMVAIDQGSFNRLKIANFGLVRRPEVMAEGLFPSTAVTCHQSLLLMGNQYCVGYFVTWVHCS